MISLPVSVWYIKNRENIPSFLTRKKTEQTENQQLFLDPSEIWGHKETYQPSHWKDRWTQRITESCEQLLPPGTLKDNYNCQRPEPCLLWEIEVLGDQPQGRLQHFSWVLPLGASPGSQSEDWGKILPSFQGKEGKVTFEIHPGHSVLNTKGLPSREALLYKGLSWETRNNQL